MPGTTIGYSENTMGTISEHLAGNIGFGNWYLGVSMTEDCGCGKWERNVVGLFCCLVRKRK